MLFQLTRSCIIYLTSHPLHSAASFELSKGHILLRFDRRKIIRCHHTPGHWPLGLTQRCLHKAAGDVRYGRPLQPLPQRRGQSEGADHRNRRWYLTSFSFITSFGCSFSGGIRHLPNFTAVWRCTFSCRKQLILPVSLFSALRTIFYVSGHFLLH